MGGIMQEREEVAPSTEEVFPTEEPQYSSPGGPKAPADIEIQGKFGPPEESYRRAKSGPAIPEEDDAERQ